MITGQITEAAIPEAVPLPLPEFAALVREHQSMVFSLALSFLRNPATAEEIAQDVFLELHRALPTLASADHVVYWLRRVTAHRSIDALRKRKPMLALVDVREPAAPAANSDVLLDGKLRDLVANLPPKARMAVILRYQEDLDPVEIAEILDIPVRTVKSRLHRSLELLREKLDRVLVRPVRSEYE
jgi:RNA polymerase sigma-70 factor, ECF subfamily